jgi:hypothetical protein
MNAKQLHDKADDHSYERQVASDNGDFEGAAQHALWEGHYRAEAHLAERKEVKRF